MRCNLWAVAAGAVVTVATAIAADVDVRHFTITNDAAATRPAQPRLKWFGGESVKLDLYARSGTTAINLSTSGVYVVWTVAGVTNNTTLYLSATGTVANGTNGYCTWDLLPENVNFPTNSYETWVRAYQTTGNVTRYVGTLYHGWVDVMYSPASTGVTYATLASTLARVQNLATTNAWAAGYILTSNDGTNFGWRAP
jgi:hypothetical protein